MVNWTIETLGLAIAAIPFTFCLVLLSSIYRKKKYIHILLLFINVLMYLAWNLVEMVSKLLLSASLFYIAIIFMFISPFFKFYMLDSISRDGIDPVKLGFNSLALAGIIISGIMPGSFVDITFPDGSSGIQPSGPIYAFVSIIGAVISVWIGIFYIRIFRLSPPSLKRYAGIAVFGAWFTVVFLPLAFIARWTYIVPAIDNLVMAIGITFIGIAWWKAPKLAYILPFNVLYLGVINKSSGLLLFSHKWKARGNLISDDMLAGMIQGINLIVGEAIAQGDVQEIKMAKGVLIYKRSENLPVFFALISTKSSRMLRKALDMFESRFYETFKKELSSKDLGTEISTFERAKNIIDDVFSFVPE